MPASLTRVLDTCCCCCCCGDGGGGGRFLSPLFPATISIGGQDIPKHTLWHPLDHKPKIGFKLAPGKGLEPPTAMIKLEEEYRSPGGAPSSQLLHKTDLWLAAQDLAHNLPLNRYVLAFDVLGFQVGARVERA